MRLQCSPSTLMLLFGGSRVKKKQLKKHSVFQFNTSVGIVHPAKILIDWERRETIVRELEMASSPLQDLVYVTLQSSRLPPRLDTWLRSLESAGNYPKTNPRDGWLQMASRGKPRGAFIRAAEVRTRWKQRERKFWSHSGWIQHCCVLLRYRNNGAAQADAVLLWHRAI